MTRLDEMPDLMTVPQFARWAGIGRNQAYEAIHRGEVPSVRFGRSIRVPRAALARMLAAGHESTGGGTADVLDLADAR